MAIRVRRTRRATSNTRFKIHEPKWRDPFPGIPGTEPEKRIFAALVQRGIFFIFQGDVTDLGPQAASSGRNFIPDFILPQYRVIIDPFSEYHHSLPEQAVRDAEKAESYSAWGWRYYHPWSESIKAPGGTARFLASIPELRGRGNSYQIPEKYRGQVRRGFVLGPHLGAGASSVGAANRKRRRFAPSRFAVGTRRRRY